MDEKTSIKETLRSFYRAIALFNQKFTYPDCPINEAIILGIIERNPGISAAKISEFIAMDKSYLSRLLDNMERKGWISRNRLVVKPFSKQLSLSEKGRKVSHETTLILDESIDKHLAILSAEERATFLQEMTSLNAILTKMMTIDVKA
jgi:DNA-binding MarR family transcriptional regulator